MIIAALVPQESGLKATPSLRRINAQHKHHAASLFCEFALPMQNLGGWPTGLELAPFGATIRCHPFLSVAICCRIGIDKLDSLLTVACCFCVLRPEWCQKWCQIYLKPIG
jgi:hypothetical protein